MSSFGDYCLVAPIAEDAVQKRETYTVEIAGLKRELPLFTVAPGKRIAVFNILGDTEIIVAAAAHLAAKLGDLSPYVIVTAEAKGIPLAFELARVAEKPWVVLRKTYKPYMGEALSAETRSITTGVQQTLYLDEKDKAMIAGQRVALVDDVITTGSTITAMRALVEEAGAEIVAEAAVFTEGAAGGDRQVVALGHLPLFTDGL